MATKKMTGNDVRVLREGLGMTTVQFGKLLGLGPSAVTRWEAKKSKAVRMDPFAARVADIIVSQSKKLGKTKFGKIVSDALRHEHDLFALWQVLSMAFGEAVKVAKKITSGGKGGKVKRTAKKTARKATRTSKREIKAIERRVRAKAVRRAKGSRAARAKRASAKAAPVKAKRAAKARAPRVRPAARARATDVPKAASESKVTPSAAKDLAEATPSANGVAQQ